MSIPAQWVRLVQSGEVQLVDAPKPQYENPHDSPEYQAFVEEMAKTCKCCPELRPCDGCLAGGICDQTECSRCRNDDNDYQEDWDE